MKKTYSGSCHCKAVRFSCELDLEGGSIRCNCSFCSKSRAWLAFAKASEVRVLEGEAMLTDYQHTPPKKSEPFLHLLFCSRCGVRPFARGGELPQMGGAFCAVNLAALDDVSDEEMAAIKVRFPDGRNDDWEHEAAHRFL